MPDTSSSIPVARLRAPLTALSCVAMSMLLSGCFSLHGKTPVETTVSQADPAEPAQTVAAAAPQAIAKKPGGLYTDPMVTAASNRPQRNGDQRRELPLRNPAPGSLAQMQASPPPAQHMASRQPVNPAPATQAAANMPTGKIPAANNLGDVVAQPTGIQANQNSIFALANAQVTAASDSSVPAYAPTRNINAVAGSMFAVRGQQAQAPVPVVPPPSAPSRAPEPKGSDGLF